MRNAGRRKNPFVVHNAETAMKPWNPSGEIFIIVYFRTDEIKEFRLNKFRGRHTNREIRPIRRENGGVGKTKNARSDLQKRHAL